MTASAHRVALVTYALRCGGVATFLFRLGRHLLRQGWTVDLITTEERGDWFDLASEYGLRAMHLGGAAERSRIAHASHVGDVLARASYDAILLNHSVHAQIALGKLPDRVIAIPVVHGDDPVVYRVACSNRHAWNVLVAPGPKLYSVAQLEAPDRPVVMIPHGVAIPMKEALRTQQRRDAPFRLAFVGRLDDSHKGISLLPEILKACLQRRLDLDLRVAGTGPDRAHLERLAAAPGLDGRIELLGPLKPVETYRLLLDSHVLLLPSTREGFGMVALEAQACGCVPISSNLPGVTDATIEDGRTGYLVGVGDVEAFAEAVARLAHAPTLWERLSTAGHDAVAAGFRLDTMGRAYEQLLQAAWSGRYPLRQPRRWHRPIDLSAIPGEGFLLEWIRRLARWLQARRAG